MQEHLKLYEDKMEKSLDELLDEYASIRAVQIRMYWTAYALIITEPRPRSSRSAT